jgi:hypothetical protein
MYVSDLFYTKYTRWLPRSWCAGMDEDNDKNLVIGCMSPTKSRPHKNDKYRNNEPFRVSLHFVIYYNLTTHYAIPISSNH